MFWFILIIIILVLLLLGSIDSDNAKEDAQDNQVHYTSNPSNESSVSVSTYDRLAENEALYKRAQEMEKQRIEELKRNMTPGKARQLRRQAEDLFSDDVAWSTDYSDLTPEQAQRKLNQMKAEQGWVSDEDYRGLRKVINGYTSITVIPPAVIALGPKEVESWFNEAYPKGVSSAVFEKVASILKPYHEEELLKLITHLSDDDLLIDWMREKKKQGKFFSDKAYEALRKKWLSQYDLEYSLNEES